MQLKLLQLQLQNILLRIISFEIFFFFSRNDVYDLSRRKEQKHCPSSSKKVLVEKPETA